jgi:hypothetical protein
MLKKLTMDKRASFSGLTSVTKKINFYDAGTRVWLFCRVPPGSECTGLQCCRPGDQLKRKIPESLKNSKKNWHTYTGKMLKHSHQSKQVNIHLKYREY